MALDTHRAAQELSGLAAIRWEQGSYEEAAELFSQAADLEKQALDQVLPDQIRTRSIFAVSDVALHFKAGRYSEAESEAYRILGGAPIQDFARRQLRELLVESWNEEQFGALPQGPTNSGIEVSIRGAAVGVGVAPYDLALQKLGYVQHLLYRVVEWRGGIGLRTAGPPPSAVREHCLLTASQPLAGSFRFQIRISNVYQPSFLTDPTPVVRIENRLPSAEDTMRGLIEILRAALTNKADEVQRTVPERDYREAFLKMIRNMSPDGKQVREMEFRELEGRIPEPVKLHEGVRNGIRSMLSSGTRPRKNISFERRVGTLRALHLDKKWLELTTKEGDLVRCDIKDVLLDDLVGPMVNHEVTVTGYRTPSREKFMLTDIELGNLGELTAATGTDNQTPRMF